MDINEIKINVFSFQTTFLINQIFNFISFRATRSFEELGWCRHHMVHSSQAIAEALMVLPVRLL